MGLSGYQLSTTLEKQEEEVALLPGNVKNHPPRKKSAKLLLGKQKMTISTSFIARAVRQIRPAKPTPGGRKSLWEVAHIILDRDLFRIAPVKYLQISSYHYERGVRRLYKHLTVTPKIIEFLHESSRRPANSRFLANFRHTETLAVNDFSLLSSLHETIKPLQAAQQVTGQANKTSQWGSRKTTSGAKDWMLPLLPKAKSLKIPRASILRAGEALSKASPSAPTTGASSKHYMSLDFSLGKLFSAQMTELIEDADEMYSAECTPVLYLADLNFLLGGNLCTFTSKLNQIPESATYLASSQNIAPELSLITDPDYTGSALQMPANTVTIRWIYVDPPGTCTTSSWRQENWESIQRGILHWAKDFNSGPNLVKHVIELHMYQAEAARDKILKLQGGVTQEILDAKPFKFIELNCDDGACT
ncbi:hypothetical protein IAR50_007590 [Cryptococcus sp. DSM 104548]